MFSALLYRFADWKCLAFCSSRITHVRSHRGPRWDGLVSASHAVGHGFASRPGHTKDHHKDCTNSLPAWYACE